MAERRIETEGHIEEIVELSNEEMEKVQGGDWHVIASDPGVGEASGQDDGWWFLDFKVRSQAR